MKSTSLALFFVSLFASSHALAQSGKFSVTSFDLPSMPYECNVPAGYNQDEGIAIIEGHELVLGAECPAASNSSGGNPDCTKVLNSKHLCGTTYKVTYKGKTKKAFLSGICPYDHPSNKSKGQWNPCARGRSHVDMVEAFYRNLGLTPAESWGPNGNTGRVNPSAATVEISVGEYVEGTSSKYPDSKAGTGNPWTGKSAQGGGSKTKAKDNGHGIWTDAWNGNQFPYCSPGTKDTGGGWGWENLASCKK